MRRGVTLILSATSFLAGSLVLYLWSASHLHGQEIRNLIPHPTDVRYRYFVSSEGELGIGLYSVRVSAPGVPGINPIERSPEYQYAVVSTESLCGLRLLPPDNDGRLHRLVIDRSSQPFEWRRAPLSRFAFPMAYRHPSKAPPTGKRSWFGFVRIDQSITETPRTPWLATTTPPTLTHEIHYAAVPHWSLAAVTFLPAVWGARHLLHAWRSHRRARRGLCIACGYDLRASTNRCPECGRPVPARRPRRRRQRRWLVRLGFTRRTRAPRAAAPPACPATSG